MVQSPSNNVMYTGDSVSFSCHINVSSGWEFLWYKDGTQLSQSGNNHNISVAVIRNSGSYSCQTQRGKNVFLSPQSQAVKLDVKGKFIHFSVCLWQWVHVSPFGLCVYSASKSFCSPLDCLVRDLLHWQVGAQMWHAGKSGHVELHMVKMPVSQMHSYM